LDNERRRLNHVITIPDPSIAKPSVTTIAVLLPVKAKVVALFT
jgi:hypothetical protein